MLKCHWRIAQDDYCTWTIQSCWLVTSCDSLLPYHQRLLVPFTFAITMEDPSEKPEIAEEGGAGDDVEVSEEEIFEAGTCPACNQRFGEQDKD